MFHGCRSLCCRGECPRALAAGQKGTAGECIDATLAACAESLRIEVIPAVVLLSQLGYNAPRMQQLSISGAL